MLAAVPIAIPSRARPYARSLVAHVAEWFIAVYLLFVYLRVFLGRPLFVSPAYPGAPGDPGMFQWYMGWVWYAITHHQPLFVTHAFGAPGGTNLMSQTTVITLGLLFGWLYRIIGVAATTNLIFIVNYLMILVFGNLTLKRLGVNRAFAWIGTALFVLTPYLSPQDYAHFHLWFIVFDFALGYLMTRWFTAQKPPSAIE